MLGPIDLTRIPTNETCASECCGNWRLDVLKGASYCGEVTRDPRDESDEAESRIDWVICGGESGPGARPMEERWAQSLARQCRTAGTAFFMKQMGGARDKRGALEDLPEDLRTREFPHA
jgi:hypothetical protein